MTIKERAAYIKGLLEGLDLDDDKKETKVLKAMAEWMEEISESVEEIDEDVDNICDELEVLDEDLEYLEDEVYKCPECDEECDCGCHEGENCDCNDEDYYEVECPTCGEKTCFSEDTLLDSEMNCPNCGELLEFGFEDCDCGCDCDDDCDCDENCECGCDCHSDK